MNVIGCHTLKSPDTRCKHHAIRVARIGHVCNIPRWGIQAYIVNSLIIIKVILILAKVIVSETKLFASVVSPE